MSAAVMRLKQEITKSYAERDATINTGAYNSYIKGYLILTLEAMGQDRETIREAAHTLQALFDDTSAQEAREKASK